MDDKSPRETFEAAIERQRHGDLGAAEVLFTEVLRALPGHPSSLHNLGLIFQGSGRHVEAVAAFQHLVDDTPDDVAARFALASALHAAGRLGDAEGVLGDIIDHEPEMVDALITLGLVLGERGRREEADEVCRRAVNLAPERPEAHYAHALAHRFSAGEPDIETMSRLWAADEISEEHKILLEFALGKAHDDVGDHDAAFSWYRRANQRKARGTRFDAARHLGEIAAIKAAFPGAQPAAGAPADGPVPLFVVGLSRSGKSLIESVLARHQAISGLEERFGWYRVVRSICDKHAINAPFPDCMADLPEGRVAEMGAAFLDAVGEAAPNCRVVIHTRPDNYKYLGLILRALPAAKVIHCRRAPMDTCLRIYFKLYKAGNEYAYDLGDIATFHDAYAELMAHWQGLYGERILDIDYEALARRPIDSVGRILRFCALEGDPLATSVTAEEVDHWKNYARHLEELRAALSAASLGQANGVRVGAQPSHGPHPEEGADGE